MTNIQNILANFKDDLYLNLSKNNENQFIYNSILHFAISLEIGINTYNKNLISYEKICNSIPKKLGSRSTIQSILNDAIQLGYFEKIVSIDDKRIKNYKLSNKFINMFEDWIENQKKILKAHYVK